MITDTNVQIAMIDISIGHLVIAWIRAKNNDLWPNDFDSQVKIIKILKDFLDYCNIGHVDLAIYTMKKNLTDKKFFTEAYKKELLAYIDTVLKKRA